MKLLIEPGEYQCEWSIPASRAGDRRHRTLVGTLGLKASSSPEGAVAGFDEAWEVDQISGQLSACFPKSFRYTAIRGRFIDRAVEILLLDVLITDYGGTTAVLAAAAAILGVDLPEEEDPAFLGIEIQTTALDALGGVRPLSKSAMPVRTNEARALTWSAESNDTCQQSWSDSDIEVRHEYDITTRLSDPYEFRVRFAPVVRVNRTVPLTFREWIDEWVDPLQAIVSAATGRKEDITYLAVYGDLHQSGQADSACQVFAIGCTQSPYYSSGTAVRDSRIAFSLARHNLSLLDIIRNWKAQTSAGNPLLEVFNPIIMGSNQHARGRFLYTLQCLEGLHGHETRMAADTRLQSHRLARHATIANIAAALELPGTPLTSKDMKFVKAWISRRPGTSLEECLKSMIAALPESGITAELAQLAVVRCHLEGIDPAQGPLDAIRRTRNDLAHGNRDYPAHEIGAAADLFYRVVRAHLLRSLGCSADAQLSALHVDY